jgi:glycosyltransferase involved in cell wall biosynthesis
MKASEPSPALLIDVTRLAARLLEGKRPTGVDRVSLAYIQRFRARASAMVRHWGRWMHLTPDSSQRLFAALLGEAGDAPRVVRSEVARAYVLRWGLPADALLFNTGHSGLDDPGYAERVRRHGLRPVYFVHDLIPLTHPECCRPGEADKHRQRLLTMLNTGHGIIANSQATLEDLRRFARDAGLRLPPSVVAHLGVEALPAPAAQAPLAEAYFVALGTIEARKNHLLLLQLWRQMSEAGLPDLPRLVLIGQRGWECEQVLDLLERCPALHGRVLELGDCGDAELANWLHHARALLFPSFVEGFGMPLVEALHAGVPVLASELPVFREIAGDVPEYLDPLDGPGWRRAVLDYARADSPLRAAQLQRMGAFRAPSWADHFAAVESALGDWKLLG